jgi:hypothetical protein
MAGTDRTEATLAAVRTKLLANAELAAIVGASGIVTRPEEAKALPFIVLSCEAQDDGTASTDAESIRLEVHCFSRRNATVTVSAAPMVQAKRLMQIVKAELHETSLAVTGHWLTRVERSLGPLPEPDPDAMHMLVIATVRVGHDTIN